MRFFMGNEDYKDVMQKPRLSEADWVSLVAKYPLSTVSVPPERKPFPDPTPEMLETSEFNAVWQAIKHWDINVPSAYGGYCGAMGNHVRVILDAISAINPKTQAL